jgi:two-component system, OmpR family, response regulator
MLGLLAQEPIDVVLLDLRLLGEDGMAPARTVQAVSKVPIIILSGRTDEADRVMGLELAADDYVTKPFSPCELVARIRAVLRRTRQESSSAREERPRAYCFAGWELNFRLRCLTRPDARSCVACHRSRHKTLPSERIDYEPPPTRVGPSQSNVSRSFASC